ncbi:MAG: Hsp70 family protein [Polyangiaceae bacterium]|nr:Hsp70 family protein [Polyangiaceae bacterium]
MAGSEYIVGIDLGTTNTVVAYSFRGGPPQVLNIPQQTAAHEASALPRLPSFLYAPGLPEAAPTAQENASETASVTPATAAPTRWIAGEFARTRAGEAPLRSIASAKSWLSHAQVNRTAPILPWGSEEKDLAKLSPVVASSLILKHVLNAWNSAFPKAPLEKQSVILTVPASFDPVARKLTVEAAALAGFSVRLLEEPQAAFYALFGTDNEALLFGLLSDSKRSAQILVCDVGGGTTDLCLIQARRSDAGALDLERTAVGRHLLLGGDNMDLTLAHFMEPKFTENNERLPTPQFAALTQACHTAKERLLGPNPPESEQITLLGEGSDLFKSRRSALLTQQEALQIILEGFFPSTGKTTEPLRTQTGLVGFGLPYERDPRVSVHLAQFLLRHELSGKGPDAVLFNGGVFHSTKLRERVLAVLRSWQPEAPPVSLHTELLDNAVALGAVRYGLALRGQGQKIVSGAAHGYYLGVASHTHERTAVCVVPKGAKEGELHVAHARGLVLQTGVHARFDLYASDSAEVHVPGQVVRVVAEHFELLPPVATRFESASRAQVEVHLEGLLTPVGTLEVACVDPTSLERFELQFELRGQEGTKGETPASGVNDAEARLSAPPESGPGSYNSKLSEGCEAIQRVFGKGRTDVKEREVRDLFRNLEKLFGERRSWDVKLCRALFDVVGPKFAARRRSADHERVFWMLAGLCLRPGFGHPLDPGRVALLEPLFEEGATFSQESRNWQAFFIAWRRLAAGVSEPTQIRMRRLLDPFLAPLEANLKKPKGFKAPPQPEMVELAAWLERVPVDDRTRLGGWLVDRTWTDRNPELWAAIGRVGARVPTYASVHHAVPGRVAEAWVDQLLREKWPEVRTAPRAALQLCRIVDDRARDVSEKLRQRVLTKANGLDLPAAYFEPLRTYVAFDGQQRLDQFEQDLPVGLSLSPPPLESA